MSPSPIVASVQRFQTSSAEAQPNAPEHPAHAEPGFAQLELDGKTYLVNPDHPRYPAWDKLLTRRADSGKRVYAESEPDGEGGERITRVEIPRVREVAEIYPIPELRGFGVRLLGSSMPRFLPQDRQDLLGVLEASQDAGGGTPSEVLITTDPATHEILDARPYVPSGGELQLLAAAVAPQFPAQLTEILTIDQAFGEFENLASQPHIPFDYPDDCCTARAHEMYRLLRLRGFGSRKLWNYGGGGVAALSALKLFTLTHPKGFVSWSMHVAPLVKVRLRNNTVEKMILDPAIFNRPARIADWVALQHDSTAVQQIDDPDLFNREFNGKRPRRDDRFFRTKDWLEDHIEIRDSQ